MSDAFMFVRLFYLFIAQLAVDRQISCWW